MSFNIFIKRFFLLSFLFLGLIALFVYFIDPFWTFSHSHKLNSLQKATNEREQKSNLLYFGSKQYDILLLGSSRVTFLNQFGFKDKKAFNYSFSSANPKNFEDYIDFAKKANKKDFEYIVIGLDFFASNENMEENLKPKEIFDDVTSFMYRYKLLLSVDALKLSLENIKRSLLNRPAGRSYNRQNQAFTTKIAEEEVIKRVTNVPKEAMMGDFNTFKYNKEYRNFLEKIKESNPNSKFIVFTTPTTYPHLKRFFEHGYKKEYELWLKDCIDVFGSVVHFMDGNSITKNYAKYFMDYHHIYPEYSSFIIDKLQDINSKTSPKDFGKVLTKENIHNYLKSIN